MIRIAVDTKHPFTHPPRTPMGIFSFFKSNRPQDALPESQPCPPMVVDLVDFKVGSTLLGAPVASSDPFHAALRKSDVFKPAGQGFEIGVESGLLDYGFFDLSSFKGSFTRAGQPVELGLETTEEDVLKTFGAPYWIDRSDGDVILFYEYRSGTVELQFEFPDGEALGMITLGRNGVLSEADQRENYGVTKPWPPP